MKNAFKNDWISIYIGLTSTRFTFGPASYFDDRWHITITPSLLIPIIGIFFTGVSLISLTWLPFLFIGYGTIYLDLPKHSGIDDSEPPEYGFYMYSEGSFFRIKAFVWCWKNRKKHFYMPWDWEWVRTSVFLNNGEWEHETKKNRKDFYKDEWENLIWKEEHSYVYVLKNGKIQNRIATIKVEEREWRWKALIWLKYHRMINKSIKVDFSYGGHFEREILFEKKGNLLKNRQSGEVGERSGSSKGGTIGCGYTMKNNETPLQTLRRMELERTF